MKKESDCGACSKKPGSKAVPTGSLINMLRIDPNLQRSLSQPSSTAPELLPRQCRGGRMGSRAPSCHIHTPASLTAPKPSLQPTQPHTGCRAKGIVFHSPTQQNSFLPSCAVNALAARQCSALHGSFILHTIQVM